MERGAFSAIRDHTLTQLDYRSFAHVPSDPDQHAVVAFKKGIRKADAFSIHNFKPFTMDFDDDDDDDMDDEDDTLNTEFDAK